MTGGPMQGFLDGFEALRDEVPSPERAALYSVVEAIRTLTISTIERDIPVEVFAELLVALKTASTAAAGSPKRVYHDRVDMARSFIDFSPIAGEANPVAPPMRLHVDGDTVRGEVRFEQSHEGPPGHAHGGMLAAAFDEALGLAQSLSGSPGMTGRLTINYRRPTPLRTAVYFECRVKEVSGRKIFTEGTSSIEVNGERVVTAEAEGLFISLSPERFLQMAAAAGSSMITGSTKVV